MLKSLVQVDDDLYFVKLIRNIYTADCYSGKVYQIETFPFLNIKYKKCIFDSRKHGNIEPCYRAISRSDKRELLTLYARLCHKLKQTNKLSSPRIIKVTNEKPDKNN